MGSPDERSSPCSNERESTGRKHFARPLSWPMPLVGRLASASCGSEAVARAASAGYDEPSLRVDDDSLNDLFEAPSQLADLDESRALVSGSGVIALQAVDHAPAWATISLQTRTPSILEESGLLTANIDVFFGDADLFLLDVEPGRAGRFEFGVRRRAL